MGSEAVACYTKFCLGIYISTSTQQVLSTTHGTACVQSSNSLVPTAKVWVRETAEVMLLHSGRGVNNRVGVVEVLKRRGLGRKVRFN